MEDKVKTLPNWRRINLSCNLWKECPHTVKICQLYCPGRSSKQGQNSIENNYSPSISLTEVKGKRRRKGRRKTSSQDCSSQYTAPSCFVQGYKTPNCFTKLIYKFGLVLTSDCTNQVSAKPKPKEKRPATKLPEGTIPL